MNNIKKVLSLGLLITGASLYVATTYPTSKLFKWLTLGLATLGMHKAERAYYFRNDGSYYAARQARASYLKDIACDMMQNQIPKENIKLSFEIAKRANGFMSPGQCWIAKKGFQAANIALYV